jgi:hypothetical protein
MAETARQRKRKSWAEKLVTWFPASKSAKVEKLHADATNRRVEKRKRQQFAALSPTPQARKETET